MIRTSIAAVVLLAWLTDVSAVSLNRKTNDDTVCDLSPYTTSWLSQRTFVPAGTPNSQEIYTRLALRFVTGACRTNQTLILHSDIGDSFDNRYFSNVATRLCGAAQIERQAMATKDEPYAFLLKCKITRLASAQAWLHAAEQEQSTEGLIAKGFPRPAQPDEVETETDRSAGERQARCKKGLTFGALLGISGGCRD